MQEHAVNVRANESPEAKKQSKMREYPVNNSHHCQTISELIDKFHNSVTFGPLYICSCCDQLWYKHIVSAAERFRFQYLNMVQYL